MKKLSILLICIIILTACSRTQNIQSIENAVNMKSEQSDEINNESGTKNIPKIYKDYMKQKDPNNAILFYAKEDIDGDGQQEVIIGCGEETDELLFTTFSHIYVLQEKNGTLHLLSNNLAEGGHNVNVVKLITLEGLSGQFVYCGLTNGPRLGGFQIYQLMNNKVQPFAGSSSAAGLGEDTLKDFNGDGHFDGYISIRSSYDSLYHTLISYYVIEKNGFVLEKTTIENMPPYPDKIKDVVNQYLNLRILDNGKCKDIKERLTALTLNDKVNNIEIIKEQWYVPLLNTILDIDEGLTFTLIDKKSEKFVDVTYKENNEQTKGLRFYMVKKNGKWSIDRIKPLN